MKEGVPVRDEMDGGSSAFVSWERNEEERERDERGKTYPPPLRL